MFFRRKDITDTMDDADSSDADQCIYYNVLDKRSTGITGMICASLQRRQVVPFCVFTADPAC